MESTKENMSVESTKEETLDNNSENAPVEPISGDFDTLVLSGGGSKGLIILGALQYIVDNNLLNQIKNYVGTSIGSIICYLLAIGYTPIEIIIEISTNRLFEKMKYLNIVAMYNGQGATTFSHIYECLEKLTIEKIGRLITFRELFEVYKKHLVCVTYNLTKSCVEYLDYTTYPNMPCLIGLKLSSNLPLIFEHFKYMNCYYTDGGIINNFPINKGDEIGNKVLGITISADNSTSFDEVLTEKNILEYVFKLINIPLVELDSITLQNISDKCKVFSLKNGSETKLYNFNINSTSRLDMFSEGYQEIKTLWNS